MTGPHQFLGRYIQSGVRLCPTEGVSPTKFSKPPGPMPIKCSHLLVYVTCLIHMSLDTLFIKTRFQTYFQLFKTCLSYNQTSYMNVPLVVCQVVSTLYCWGPIDKWMLEQNMTNLDVCPNKQMCSCILFMI